MTDLSNNEQSDNDRLYAFRFFKRDYPSSNTFSNPFSNNSGSEFRVGEEKSDEPETAEEEVAIRNDPNRKSFAYTPSVLATDNGVKYDSRIIKDPHVGYSALGTVDPNHSWFNATEYAAATDLYSPTFLSYPSVVSQQDQLDSDNTLSDLYEQVLEFYNGDYTHKQDFLNEFPYADPIAIENNTNLEDVPNVVHALALLREMNKTPYSKRKQDLYNTAISFNPNVVFTTPSGISENRVRIATPYSNFSNKKRVTSLLNNVKNLDLLNTLNKYAMLFKNHGLDDKLYLGVVSAPKDKLITTEKAFINNYTKQRDNPNEAVFSKMRLDSMLDKKAIDKLLRRYAGYIPSLGLPSSTSGFNSRNQYEFNDTDIFDWDAYGTPKVNEEWAEANEALGSDLQKLLGDDHILVSDQYLKDIHRDLSNTANLLHKAKNGRRQQNIIKGIKELGQ